MKQLILTQGLPGSGKTTWANEQAEQANRDSCDGRPCERMIIVCKDDIRRELGGTHSKEREAEVVRIRDSRIANALQSGQSVISADTNFARTHKVRLEGLARQHGAAFSIQRFRTPIEECVRRDALRDESVRVGRSVIDGMVKSYKLDTDPTWYGTDPTLLVPRYTPTAGLPWVILSDLDGTLALFDEKAHRGPYDASRCDEDDANYPVLATLVSMRQNGWHVIYLSAREDTYRTKTEWWLKTVGAPAGPLYMRPALDGRKDWIVKSELFEAHIRGKYNVLYVLDDRNQVVNFWRRLGLTVFQVAEGDF